MSAETFSKPILRDEILSETQRRHGLLPILAASAFSKEAHFRVEDFEIAKRRSQVVIKDRCPDARTDSIFDLATFTTSSIASAGDPNYYTKLYNHPSSKIIVSYTHFDAEETKRNRKSTGCGGQGAKEMEEEDNPALHKLSAGIKEYVHNDISTSDPIILAFEKARRISRLAPNKIVLAAVLDHLSLKLNIFAAMTKGGKISFTKINPFAPVEDRYFFEGREDEIISEIQRADINDDRLADAVFLLREHNNRQRNYILDQNELRQSQKIQNPFILHIGTGVSSIKYRLPGLFEGPNCHFSLRVPMVGRQKKMLLQKALNQAEYPLTHAVESIKKGSGQFFDMRTILIEAPDEPSLREITEDLSTVFGLEEWLDLGGRIIISEFEEGKIIKSINHFEY